MRILILLTQLELLINYLTRRDWQANYLPPSSQRINNCNNLLLQLSTLQLLHHTPEKRDPNVILSDVKGAPSLNILTMN